MGKRRNRSDVKFSSSQYVTGNKTDYPERKLRGEFLTVQYGKEGKKE